MDERQIELVEQEDGTVVVVVTAANDNPFEVKGYMDGDPAMFDTLAS